MTSLSFGTVADEIGSQISKCDEFAIDLETTGLDPLHDSIIGVALAAGDNAWYLPVTGSRAFPRNDILMLAKGFLANKDKTAVFHNGVFDIRFLAVADIPVFSNIADTMIAAWMLDETRAGSSRLKLKGKGGLVWEYYGIELEEYKHTALAGMLPGIGKDAVEYGSDDAKYTLLLWQQKLKPGLKRDPHLWRWFTEVEMVITRLIARMENYGFLVDVNFLHNAEGQIIAEMEKLERTVYEQAGCQFKLGSPVQVASVFYDKLGFKPPIDAKTGQGKKSINKGFLASFVSKDPAQPNVVDTYLAWKGREKMLGTYIRGIANQAMKDDNHRIHSDFWQAGTETGRFSSRNPNIENLPRSQGFKWQYTFPVKKAFIAPPGHVLVVHDYSQLELRIMAHQCQDPTMLDVYQKGKDIHEVTRSALGADTPRTIAKNVNFGLLYKQTPEGLQRFLWQKARIDTTLVYCIDLHEKFFAAYPGLATYHEKIEEQIRRKGVVFSLVGRPRYLKYYASISFNKAVRIGINFTIQGCLDGSEPVLTECGYVPIRDLSPTKDVIFDGAAWTNNYKVRHTGDKGCFRVTLSDGTSVICSADHRWLSYDGAVTWLRTSELTSDSMVCRCHQIAPDGKYTKCSENIAYLIGVLLGDGHYGSSCGFTIAASSKDLDWKRCIERVLSEENLVFSVHRRRSERGGLCDVFVVNNTEFRDSLLILGLNYVTKKNKRVPDWLFSAPTQLRAALLRGVFDTDGCSSCSVVTCKTVVPELAEQYHSLLLSLGIPNDLKNYKSGYMIYIPLEGIERFKQLIGFSHPKKAALLANIQGKGLHRKMRIPKALARAVWYVLSNVHGMSKTECARKAMLKNKQNGAWSASSLLRKYIPTSPLIGLVESPWDTIVSITPVGIRDTWDIELFGKRHGYVVKGVIMHNSAADIMKLAMRNIFRRVQSEHIWQHYQYEMVDQVHDELVSECLEEGKEAVCAMVKHEMENALKLAVPLIADGHWGKNWDEAKS